MSNPEILSAQYGGVQILAMPGYPHPVIPIMVAEGQNLAVGTVIGIQTSGGLAVAYAEGNSDGSQVPKGILKEAVNASSTTTFGSFGQNKNVQSGMYVGGMFQESDLVGLDSNAITLLPGAVVLPNGVFKFG